MWNYIVSVVNGGFAGLNVAAIVLGNGGWFNYTVGGMNAAVCLIYALKAGRET